MLTLKFHSHLLFSTGYFNRKGLITYSVEEGFNSGDSSGVSTVLTLKFHSHLLFSTGYFNRKGLITYSVEEGFNSGDSSGVQLQGAIYGDA